MKKNDTRILSLTVIVSALGYFVDIYDLVLFGVVRVPSLLDLGLSPDEAKSVGLTLLDLQMWGMLIGGLLWGILGDKRGRVSVLFGSIFLYSVANILNAFVTDVHAYGVLRLLAGVGLAGELGAAITLVSEVSHKHTRGYATSVVAGVGVSGAILAGMVGQYASWKTAYLIGGVLGLLLLVLRFKLFDSGMYDSLKQERVSRGNFLKLFTDNRRAFKYVNSILIGTPIWFVIGLLVFFSPEFARNLGVQGTVVAANSVMMAYAGLVLGDFGSGLLSQWARSRKKIVAAFLAFTALIVNVYCFSPAGQTPGYFYLLCFLLGIGVGYWAVFVTMASEQFGTNVRATVTTTVPNFVRGSVPVFTLAFRSLTHDSGWAPISAAYGIGMFAIALAGAALWALPETFGKDLDYVEKL